jgi:hypothetical protein
VTLNKPRYVGTAVLGLSKHIMDDFHYNYVMKDYPQAKLLFTDTDSFCYLIETDNDVYKDIKDNQWFDFSNYVEVHNNFDESKELTPGFFKDEFAGRFLLEFVGLRAKMYPEDYRNSLLKKQQFTNKMIRITQEKHKLFTVEIEKKSLSPFNDKKWITRDNENFISYSYGHYKIAECEH